MKNDVCYITSVDSVLSSFTTLVTLSLQAAFPTNPSRHRFPFSSLPLRLSSSTLGCYREHVTSELYQFLFLYYRLRSRGDNTFGSVRLCVSVRLSVGALLFEPFDLDFSGMRVDLS